MPVPVVGWIMTAVATVFRSRLGMWIAGALVFLGIELAANEVVMTPLMGMLQQRFDALPSDVAAWAGFLNIDRYCSIVASAYVTAWALGAASNVTMKKKAGA